MKAPAFVHLGLALTVTGWLALGCYWWGKGGGWFTFAALVLLLGWLG